MEFGEHMKSLREKQRISLCALGKRIKFNPGYLSRVENGKVPPSDKLIRALVKKFDAPDLFHSAGRTIPQDILVQSAGQGCMSGEYVPIGLFTKANNEKHLLRQVAEGTLVYKQAKEHYSQAPNEANVLSLFRAEQNLLNLADDWEKNYKPESAYTACLDV